MPRGYKNCGVCKGTGKVQENSDYEFLLRDPITSRCLNCDGSGYVSSRSGVNRKALEKARNGSFPQKAQMDTQIARISSTQRKAEGKERKAEGTEGTEARGLKSTQRPAEASVPERSDGEMIEVTIRCRLTYEQLAQVMKYNEVSQGDK